MTYDPEVQQVLDAYAKQERDLLVWLKLSTNSPEYESALKDCVESRARFCLLRGKLSEKQDDEFKSALGLK